MVHIENMKVIGVEGWVRYQESKYARLHTQEEIKFLLKNTPEADIVFFRTSLKGIHNGRNLA